MGGGIETDGHRCSGEGGGGEGGREMEANGHRGRGEGMWRKGMEGGEEG